MYSLVIGSRRWTLDYVCKDLLLGRVVFRERFKSNSHRVRRKWKKKKLNVYSTVRKKNTTNRDSLRGEKNVYRQKESGENARLPSAVRNSSYFVRCWVVFSQSSLWPRSVVCLYVFARGIFSHHLCEQTLFCGECLHGALFFKRRAAACTQLFYRLLR